MLVTFIIRTGISDAVSFPRKRRVEYMARTRFSLITHTQAERETRVNVITEKSETRNDYFDFNLTVAECFQDTSNTTVY